MGKSKKTLARRKAKMGRPTIPREELRRNRVMVTLTDAEFEKLQRLAGEKDQALGTAIRDVLVRALKRRK